MVVEPIQPGSRQRDADKSVAAQNRYQWRSMGKLNSARLRKDMDFGECAGAEVLLTNRERVTVREGPLRA